MGYAETEAVEAGKKFTSPSGMAVETTGMTVLVDSHDMYVHEVEILEGVGEGNRFLAELGRGGRSSSRAATPLPHPRAGHSSAPRRRSLAPLRA